MRPVKTRSDRLFPQPVKPVPFQGAMHSRPHILVVDDEPQITRVLRTSLNAQGYDIRVANDGETALEIVKDFAPDLVITDLAMPNMDGVELCRQLRKISQVPILVLSVRGDERSKIEALDSGADDYITKPFSTGELLARIRAALRRSPPNASQPLTKIDAGDFRIDLEAHTVAVAGTRGSPDAEGIRCTGIHGAASAKGADPPGNLECRVGQQ